MRIRGPALLAGWLLAVAMVACAESDDADETLAPLPISGPTPPAVIVTTSIPGATSAIASGTPSTDTPQLVGDWDGAEFDVGVIDRVGELGGYRTIEFDRYSYRDPTRGVTDATGFVEEPIAYGWRQSPFVNVQEQLRTFVLAEDVEVLVLAEGATEPPCRDQDPAPRATWVPVESMSYLDQPGATEAIASLTYSDDGQVVRIRFTRGCER